MLANLLRSLAGIAATGLVLAAAAPAAVLCPIPVPPCPFGGSCPAPVAKSADGFVDSIGVNTHMSFAPSNYAGGAVSTTAPDYTRANAALTSLGVRYVRDNMPIDVAFNGSLFGEFKTLAARGIKLDAILPYPSYVTPALLAQFAPLKAAGVLASVEPVNETDNAGRPYIAVVQGQPAIHAAAAAVGVPALGPSLSDPRNYPQFGYSGMIASADVANLHIYGGTYATGPGQPYTPQDSLQPTTACGSYVWGQAKPVQVTESGYPTTQVLGWSVTADVQATYLERELLSNYGDGVQRTYIYELADEAPYQPSWTGSFGITAGDFTPKPAFAQIKTLISLLADPGQPAAAVAPLLAAVPTNTAVRSIELVKRDGSHWLGLWQDAPLWDPIFQRPLPLAPAVTLNIATSRLTAASIYRLAAGAVPVSQQAASSVHQVAVGAGDITLVRLS